MLPKRTTRAALGLVCAALAFAVPARGVAQRADPAQVSTVGPQSPQDLPGQVAAQVGAKLGPSHAAELAVGTSVTGTLTDSAKLAMFGARDVHAGARVTITRIKPDRIRIEVDELDPVPRTSRLTLRLDAEGKVSVIVP